MERSGLIVRGIWAACLIVAGLNHVRVLALHGLSWDYGGLHWASTLYLSSLTLLDPFVAALLFIRPRVGIASTIVLIFTNVIHNLSVTAYFAPEDEFLSRAAHPILLSQIGFMLFVFVTAPLAWGNRDRS